MAKYLRKGSILLRIDECVDCNECIDCKEKTEQLKETISTNTVITDFEEEIVDKTKKKKKKNEKEDK